MNSHIHPVMQRAIAPFLTALTPPPVENDRKVFAMCSCSQCGADIGMGLNGVSACKDHTPKAVVRSTTLKAPYTTEAGDLIIEFDYQPAERATRYEPGCDESVDIVALWAGPFDMLEHISDDSLAFFKEKALEYMADAKTNDDYDRGEERYEDRMCL